MRALPLFRGREDCCLATLIHSCYTPARSGRKNNV
jgi:hypothetical protein